MTQPVIVVDYETAWPAAFKALSQVYQHALGPFAVGIEHVGSTAVPGCAAKPIIDIDVVISARSALPAVVACLAELGYRHQGDLGVPGREAFSAEGAADVPRAGAGRVWPSHHLYVCARDCAALQRHRVFRDWLRAHPAQAAAYAALKRRLAAGCQDDRTSYTEAKTAFIEAALRESTGQPDGPRGDAV